MKSTGCERSKQHANKRNRLRCKLDRQLKKKHPARFWVFRDGRRSEVRNYAIVGRTLWVFTEQQARKIPVSDLDVEATKKVNAGRGVEVPLP